ncbi:MAG TPA: hypothetical protein VMG35_02895 [Bryobacteraceae bacterium]|nr:hypothetical protein [Bryobacteraceae bacterium]
MATIKLTDQLGLDVDAQVPPSSSFLQYFKELPSLILNHVDLSKVGGLTLDQPAIQSLTSGISFAEPVGASDAGLTIQAGLHGSLEFISRTPALETLPDVAAETVEIPKDTCYVAFGVEAAVGVSAGPTAGDLQFGVAPNSSFQVKNYRNFPLKQGITLLDAVRLTVPGFMLPARISDLANLEAGCLVTVDGAGSLTLSATANLLAVTNPLASMTLPAPLPALGVTAGGSAQVGASFAISCAYQICAHKLANGHVRLGWFHDTSKEVAVSASVSEGVAAGFGTTDLFSTIVTAISRSAQADLDELQRAGLSTAEIAAIQSAVQTAVARKLEIALSAELSTTKSADAAFLFDVDLAALTPASSDAVERALRGDLTALHAPNLPGIAPVLSVWDRANTKGVQLEVNLLGILNFGSVSALTLAGEVLYEPVTGALVVTDSAAASRIRSTAVNFGADTQKLRHVMAESFLLTAAYQGSQQQVGAPALACSHSFFDLENSTDANRMRRQLRVGAALGLFSPGEADPPPGVVDFGRSMIHATTRYDAKLTTALFADPAGMPLPVEFYETVGRTALQLLVGASDDDAPRRRPAIDDDLWRRMKTQGQPGIPAMFPGLAKPLVNAIVSDYSAIRWWADAMAGAAERLAAIRKWFAGRSQAALSDPEFQDLRRDLATHLEKVAANTSEQFGQPWGLVAMDEASGRRAGASILITGPKLVRSQQRGQQAGATA